MSLEVLNSPPLIGTLTAGCYGLLPLVTKHPMLVQGSAAALPFVAVKGVNALSYGLGFVSVGRPGRYDGAASVTEKDGIRKGTPQNDARKGMEQMGTSRGRTLVPPAPWAFVIWAPIFLGELFMVATPLVTKVSPRAETILRETAGPFALAQVFTALWTASFRPKYGSKGGIYKYVSALGLAGIAASLSVAHKAFSGPSGSGLSGLEYVLYCLPLSLHFGWTTAAALVNVNGMFALATSDKKASKEEEAKTARAVALLGNASVVLATAIGVSVTRSRNAPVFGGVICWALTAVASGLKKRIEASSGKKSETVGVYGAERQRSLSLLGAAICASVVASVILQK
mmetsp:Transcript_7601/g.18609  ORF Transcript_7601/g.18609 Transcript_7601/m.18609 type:complete len:342 (+) Transcript_7601:255-1280(+)